MRALYVRRIGFVDEQKEDFMKLLYRWILVFVFLVAALASYSAGSSTGVFLFVILGFLFECGFWVKLFPTKKKSN
jgi:hypothetical protein